MFDLSLSETGLILVAALILIGPEELPYVVRSLRKWLGKSREVFHNISKDLLDIEEATSLKKEVHKLNEDIKRIVDLDGNLQETYDISDIMPDFKKIVNEQKAENKEDKNLK